MSAISGQCVVSTRKRILAYCAQHRFAVPETVLALDPLYGIALVDVGSPEKSQLVGETVLQRTVRSDLSAGSTRKPGEF